MSEIVLSDAFLESLVNNPNVTRDFPVIQSIGDSLRGINRRGCKCNWGSRITSTLEQLRGSICAMPPDDILKLKKLLNMEDRLFVAFRKVGNQNTKVSL